jgi:PPOX class probable F420-dependent enzyme
MVRIPDEFRDLLEKKALAHLATLMPDGSPQVTPVWFDYDGEYFRINTAAGRQKDRNMRRNAKVALSIADPDEPERSLRVRGVVRDIREEGADAHIDALSRKYNGKAWKPVPNQKRVIYKIKPEKISTST